MEDTAFPETLRRAFMNELKALESLGFPHVGFLLQYEYTQNGAVKEVSSREERRDLVVLRSLILYSQVSQNQVTDSERCVHEPAD